MCYEHYFKINGSSKKQGGINFEIEINYSKLKEDLKVIPIEFVKLKELDGHAKGTKMSISDLIAYLIG